MTIPDPTKKEDSSNERDMFWEMMCRSPLLMDDHGLIRFLMDILVGSINGNMPVGNLRAWAQKHHVAPATVYRWKRRLEETGMVEEVKDGAKLLHLRMNQAKMSEVRKMLGEV